MPDATLVNGFTPLDAREGYYRRTGKGRCGNLMRTNITRTLHYFKGLPEVLMERAAIREVMKEAVQKGGSKRWKKQADIGPIPSPVDTLMKPTDIALLVGGPLIILLFLWETHRQGKLVLRWRGLFRLPASLLVSAFGILGTSLLYAKVNPYVRNMPHPCAKEF